jgi:hypothetical protein
MATEGSFQTFWLPQARKSLEELARRAKAAGIGRELAALVKTLEARLIDDPLALGEVYRIRGAVQEHTAIHGFLAVDLGIDVQKKVVVVRTCTALSGHGL